MSASKMNPTDVKSLSTVWYTIELSGALTYTSAGYSTYKALFARADIDIRDISTLDDHKAAMAKLSDRLGHQKK
jgi:hypothetical protein